MYGGDGIVSNARGRDGEEKRWERVEVTGDCVPILAVAVPGKVHDSDAAQS